MAMDKDTIIDGVLATTRLGIGNDGDDYEWRDNAQQYTMGHLRVKRRTQSLYQFDSRYRLFEIPLRPLQMDQAW